MARRVMPTILLLTLFSFVGCGGGGGGEESDEEQIVAAVENYNVAVADKDGPAACDLLSASGQQQVADNHGYGGTLGLDATQTTATCEQGIENRYLGENALFEKLKFADVSNVQVRGDEAEAQVKPNGFAPVTVKLASEGGEWLLVKPIPPMGEGF